MPQTARRSRRAIPPVVTYTTGPYKGVRNTHDPLDDDPEFLVDAVNLYLPDSISASGFYARSGFDVENAGSPLAGAGQGIHTHVALNGTTYNFLCAGGHLYRTDAGLTSFTDVTPASGVTISSTAYRVYFLSFADVMIVSDGVNPPWLATNLSSTPVTGTPIDFDGAGTAWAAFGQPTVYQGSVFFILDNINTVGARTDVAWSISGDPAVGYQQTDYDFRWTLEQTASSPLYAIRGTNVALYYWRDQSIGAIAGTPGPDLQTTATTDAIAENIGTLAPATVHQFGNVLYFCDQVGKPWRLPLGGTPDPIWLNLRGVIDTSTVAYPTATGTVAVGVIEPNLNLYLVAIWSPLPGTAAPPVELQAFDAKTGMYVGRWTIAGGVTIEALGVLNDNVGRGSVVVIGSLDPYPLGATGGYVWAQNLIVGGGDPFVTEDSADYLVTEDGMQLTTEDTVPSWLDNGAVPDLRATTGRLGYSGDHVLNVDRATIVALTDAPCQVTAVTPTTSGTVEGTPSPALSQDGTYRLVCGFDVQGRGVQVTVQPTTALSQWSLQQVGIVAVPSIAGPEEP